MSERNSGMAIVVPNASEQLALKNILNYTSPQDQLLKLFCSNTTPSGSTVAGDFTEATGGGYSSKSLTGTSWTITTNASNEAEATYAAQTFTFTGALTTNTTIYGYYVVQASSGLLMWAERFASTFTPAVNGDALTFTPKYQAFSEN